MSIINYNLEAMKKKNKDSISVGVFDSGVGGLSVLKHLQSCLPDITYYYCSDNKYFPG